MWLFHIDLVRTDQEDSWNQIISAASQGACWVQPQLQLTKQGEGLKKKSSLVNAKDFSLLYLAQPCVWDVSGFRL